MKTTCDICGGFAGFETSPEGEACYKCDRWVCSEHAHHSDNDLPIPLCEDCYLHLLHKAELYGQSKVIV